MGLPDIIELSPFEGPIQATVTVPGSKSITNRAMALAALSSGTTTLQGSLWSEDTQVMTECLRTLGFKVEVEDDPGDSCNRIITVTGAGGDIPNAGNRDEPLELFVGNAGTAARFLTAMVCLGNGSYRLSGIDRMHERPQDALFTSLRELGYQVDSPNGFLPAVVHGEGPKQASCRVSIEKSSQFASALLLSAKVGEWEIQVEGSHSENSPYIEMTRSLIEAFPSEGGQFQVEPDASSGSYLQAANWIQSVLGGSVHTLHWPESGWQIDADFPKYLPLPETLSREEHLGDSVMTSIVLAALADGPTVFTDLGRLRVQECERVVALRTELTRCGGRVEEEGDTLTVRPSELHGADIQTYNDHRMAMCFAVLGMKIPGIRIHDPSCVRKTFPNFFNKLAAPTPSGLGLVLRDGKGAVLDHQDLFTD